VPLRRIFLLGAATLLSVAALGAIVAILGGEFGDTEGKFTAASPLPAACRSAAIAGIACLERSVVRPFGVLGVGLSLVGFVLSGALGVWLLWGVLRSGRL